MDVSSSAPSAAPDPSDDQRLDLVLEGGGVKGIALVGALEVLEERGYRFNRVAASSAGAVAGAMVTAGIPATTMVRILREVDYTRFRDAPAWTRLPLGKVISIWRFYGVYLGRYMAEWLDDQMRTYGTNYRDGTFADLPYRDPAPDPDPEPGPERTLPEPQRFRLVVTASDLSRGRLRYLPRYFPELGKDPGEQRIVDAVRASTALPFYYRPVVWADREGRKHWLVDGGILSNFPIWAFDSASEEVPRWPTFGIKLSSREDARRGERHRITGPVSFGAALLHTLVGNDSRRIDSPDAVVRTIFIDTGDVAATDFDLSDADREMLYRRGREAATRFLDGTPDRPGWDFDRYIAKHRTTS